MTLVLRYTDPPTEQNLGAVGVCRVGLADVVGAWGVGAVVRVILLEGC